MPLQAIKYERGSLKLLDQRLLPFEETFLDTPTPQAAWDHIRDMVVRGAPAIGVTGALALAVELHNSGAGKQFASVPEAVAGIGKTLDFLVTSRPTAVNLADTAAKLKAVASKAAAATGASPESVVRAVITAAEASYDEDIAANKAIGAHGARALLEAVAAKRVGSGAGAKLRVLTHCNTGSLATAEYGTALGVIRALAEQGKLEHAYCTETRPYNQGARLTAYELVHDGLPATLICDSAAAALMAAGRVDAVVVGADRVVANGDAANKIGTHMLSVAAAHHGLPFFIAAPTTTIDPELRTGEGIVIEQRSGEEVTHFKGQRVAAKGIQVWNPAFDVAQAKLIHGIITEKGTIPKQGDSFLVRQFMADNGLLHPTPSANGTAPATANGTESPPSPPPPPPPPAAATAATAAAAAAAYIQLAPGFRALDIASLREYLLQRPKLSQHVGPAESASAWSVKEVGDGNINFVYIVEGPAGGLCVKQALPYVRCVGESWPLTQDRVRIEAEALMEEHQLCPQHVPKVYLFDPAMSLIVMEYLAPPFVILRKGIIAGKVYPHLAQHVALFMAETLFATSLFKLDAPTFRQRVQQYTNVELCKLTEQVIFTEPYCEAANNHWTSPQLDADAAALRADVAAKVAAAQLKAKFCGCAEALIHGDLHTGSIMVTPTSSQVIDPEFAFVGPMAFDVGKIIGELLLAYFAAAGHGARAAQQAWLARSVEDVWTLFRQRFVELWDSQGHTGDLYPAALYGSTAPGGDAARRTAQDGFMARLLADSLQFAGAFMIRRLVGIAHVADMDTIADPDVRAACERRALRFGRWLLVEGHVECTDITHITRGGGARGSSSRPHLEDA